ncbi:MAG: hypothetical protein R3C01_17230, partial [Planctomycetaceae bacterium]
MTQRILLIAGLLLAFVSICPTVSAEGWPSEVRGDGYVCHADFILDDYWEMLAELSGAQRDLAEVLDVPKGTQPFHVCLFAQRDAMRQHIHRHFP